MSGPNSGSKDESPDGDQAAVPAPAREPVSATDDSAAQSKIAAALAVDEADLKKIDAILADEDPLFTKQINEFKKEEITDPSLEELGIEDFIDAGKGEQGSKIPLPKKRRRGLISFLSGMARGLASLFRRKGASSAVVVESLSPSVSAFSVTSFFKGASTGFLKILKEILRRFKAIFVLFWKMPLKKKMVAGGALAMMGVLVFVIKKLKAGDLLPDFKVQLVSTVAAFPDGSWTFDPEEPLEDFFSPIRLPEHVVLLEKMVVNIKPSPSSDKNPMGYFEFYLEADTQEAAVEIGDRQAEVSDAVQRTLEEITYDELITPSGKFKTKLIIRQNVNAVLTRGRVRKVFIGSMVVKP